MLPLKKRGVFPLNEDAFRVDEQTDTLISLGTAMAVVEKIIYSCSKPMIERAQKTYQEHLRVHQDATEYLDKLVDIIDLFVGRLSGSPYSPRFRRMLEDATEIDMHKEKTLRFQRWLRDLGAACLDTQAKRKWTS